MPDGEIFKIGQVIQLGNYRCVVDKILGDGTQGEVVKVNAGGDAFALKWYKPGAADSRQMQNLQKLATRGAPDPEKFLWPLHVGQAPRLASFGYLMKLREPRFHEADEYLRGKLPVRRRQLVAACTQVAHCLSLVHQNGLCYCDISLGNVAFDPDTGEVRILDNDNVKIDSEAADYNTSGTDGFIAPEVIRKEKPPSTATDRFGLSVLMFMLLVQRFPFEGSLMDTIPGWDDTKDLQINGKPAPFIFHETDKSNQVFNENSDPLTRQKFEKGLRRWNELPSFMRALFTNAFVNTVNRPVARDTTSHWRDELLKLHDAVLSCPGCMREIYFDSFGPRSRGLELCLHCKHPIPLPVRLELTSQGSGRILPVSAATRLFAAHIDPQSPWGLTVPLAGVEVDPAQPGVLTLKNLTGKKWIGTHPDGKFFDIEPASAVAIQHEMKVDFGKVKGRFQIQV